MLILGAFLLAVAAILWVIDHFVVAKYPLLRASVGFVILSIFVIHYLEAVLQ